MTRYRLQKKNLPPAAPAPGGAPVDPALGDPALDETADQGRQWAGEPYVGDNPPTGPGPDTFASFSHPNGESAWLDKTEDGTLTGWVLAADGTLYQYADADAWSADVDGAQMAEDGGDSGEEGDPGEEAGEGDDFDEDLTGDNADTGELGDDFEDEDDDEEEDANVTLDDDSEDDDGEDDLGYQDAPGVSDDGLEDEQFEDEEEEDVVGRWQKGKQVKSFPAATTSGRRLMARVEPYRG